MSDPFDIAANAAQQSGQTLQATPVIPVTSHTDEDNDTGASTGKADVTKLDDNTFIINGRKVQRRAGYGKQQLNKEHWTPDKFVQDAAEAEAEGRDPIAGIIVPGEVDEAHTEFLKNTEMVD